MRKELCVVASILLLAGMTSCRAKRPAVTPMNVTVTASDYVNTYKDLAISEMRRTGVPASITLAQGMLESDFGRSSLARLGNNHFGIKCHNDWTGQTIYQHDDRRNECFRKYRRPEDSFYDHSDFLRSGSRYSFLFQLNAKDYKGWAHGLKKAGYATNPDYANLLIRKIEENRLDRYDDGYTASVSRPVATGKIPDKPAPPKTQPAANAPEKQNESTITFGDVMARAPRIMVNNRVQYIIVKDGETRAKIENDFNLLKWELARYNELDPGFTPVPGQVLYIEPKRDKADTGIEFYDAAQGDTMYNISQKFAIRLKSLLEMNRMTEGENPVAGQKIWLQETRPVN